MYIVCLKPESTFIHFVPTKSQLHFALILPLSFFLLPAVTCSDRNYYLICQFYNTIKLSLRSGYMLPYVELAIRRGRNL